MDNVQEVCYISLIQFFAPSVLSVVWLTTCQDVSPQILYVFHILSIPEQQWRMTSLLGWLVSNWKWFTHELSVIICSRKVLPSAFHLILVQQSPIYLTLHFIQHAMSHSVGLNLSRLLLLARWLDAKKRKKAQKQISIARL